MTKRKFKVQFKHYTFQTLMCMLGVGTFGLECISRNCKHVTFFENYSPALEMLKRNVKNLKCDEKTKIMEKDVYYFICLSLLILILRKSGFNG